MQASLRECVAFALVCLAVVGLGGCGSKSTANPLAVEVEEAPDSRWAPTGLPYGAREDDGDTLRLSYLDRSVSLPATDPAWTKAASDEPGAETPLLELSTAGATADAGIFQLTPPGGESEVWELTADGHWQQIGSGLTKIALADVTGHLATWVVGAGPNEEKREGTKVVAYDTGSDKMIGELDGARMPGNYLRVTAVDGDAVVVQTVQDSDDAYWSRNYTWNPKTGDLVEFSDARPVDRITVTDFDQESKDRVLLSFDEPSRVVGPESETSIGSYGFGQFNSDATEVVLEGFGQVKLLDMRTMKPIPLDVPISDNAFVAGAFSWTADDRLAVLGSMDSQAQEAWICTTNTGTCESLGNDYLWSSSRENSALGQFAYHDEPEGD